MRFISKYSRMKKVYWTNCLSPRKGYTTNKFLWFPVTIDGETRWLEKVKIVWKIYQSDNRGLISNEWNYYWRPVKFK